MNAHMDNSAEGIAKVVRDLRSGNIVQIVEIEPEVWESWQHVMSTTDQIVDTTKVYEQFVGGGEIALYEDHVLIPPWRDAFISYVNEHGNVHVCHVAAAKADVSQHWESDLHHIDWDEAEWVTAVIVYMGGYSNTKGVALPTMGPMHGWLIASNKDGTIQDIRWVHFLKDQPMDMWDNVLLAVLKTYDFLACVNVEVAEPHRTRAMHRRIQREIGDMKVTEIRVRPISKSGGGESTQDGQNGFTMPLHTVRGHFARYGDQYGRKKLFGKYEGKFFIPAHAKGSEEAGKREHSYIIEPDTTEETTMAEETEDVEEGATGIVCPSCEEGEMYSDESYTGPGERTFCLECGYMETR